MRDPSINQPWKHLRVQRLPVNSTSVTQPLDAGVISVFKRAFLEMLSHESHLVRTFNMAKAISNGHAWSIIPYAWNSVKATTLRNCFAETPVLPEEMRQSLKTMSTTKAERNHALRYTRRHLYEEQERAYFEHLVASVNEANSWNLNRIAEKDVQDVLEDKNGPCPSVEDSNFPDLSDEVQGPISPPESLHTSVELLAKLSGGHDMRTPEGMEAMLDNAKKSNRVRSFLKKL
ncbi:hypothetical protein BX616_007929, partial [Lobosporangium transversale]